MAASSYKTGRAQCSDTISGATGQLHVHLSCLHHPALGDAQLQRAMTAATCLVTASPSGLRVMGASTGQASHSFSRYSGEEESPSIHTGMCVGATSVILVEAVDRTKTSTGQGDWAACVLTGALKGPVRLDAGFQSHLSQFHEQTQERTTSVHSSARCHHPQRQSSVSAMHGKPCPQSWDALCCRREPQGARNSVCGHNVLTPPTIPRRAFLGVLPSQASFPKIAGSPSNY